MGEKVDMSIFDEERGGWVDEIICKRNMSSGDKYDNEIILCL